MKKTRILSLVLALMMLLGIASAGSAESLNLAQLPLTDQAGATVSILGMNSWYSTVQASIKHLNLSFEVYVNHLCFWKF